jgi:hypothetical protein
MWISILGIIAILGGGGYWAFITKDNYETTDNNYLYL